MGKKLLISRSISAIQRMSNAYYDKKLKDHNIGCGQQFFLLCISDYPGMSVQEIAGHGQYDKATATRAIQKLEAEGYVTSIPDQTDRRIRHVYVTPKAETAVRDTKMAVNGYLDMLTMGFSEEEIRQTEHLLERMMANAKTYFTKKEYEKNE